MDTTRISSVNVHLIQVLSRIIRENFKFNVSIVECWTFGHVLNWEIIDKKHPGFAGIEPYYFTEHEQSLYFGSGHFVGMQKESSSASERIEIRTVCELSKWVPVCQSHWTFRVWVKRSDGRVERHCFRKFSFSDSIDEEKVPKNMRDKPPKKIAFKEDKTIA